MGPLFFFSIGMPLGVVSIYLLQVLGFEPTAMPIDGGLLVGTMLGFWRASVLGKR